MYVTYSVIGQNYQYQRVVVVLNQKRKNPVVTAVVDTNSISFINHHLLRHLFYHLRNIIIISIQHRTRHIDILRILFG